MGTPLWICESCGGPAVWTFIGGEPWYCCEVECEGFRQLELFDHSGVELHEGRMPGDARPEKGQGNNELEELPF